MFTCVSVALLLQMLALPYLANFSDPSAIEGSKNICMPFLRTLLFPSRTGLVGEVISGDSGWSEGTGVCV